ncbi:MAG: SprT-like domain-containing protein [Bacilli bacterium]|nr:SprT-like domain-containing protein [Bacilli bacterium]
MAITIEYLKERHQYWSQKLYDLGIFKNILKSITFEIKYGVKTYNGVFRWRKNNGIAIEEKIIIYPNIINIDLQWVDNVLVHEMIHQYIFDYNLKDSSSHGFQFKALMRKINDANIGVKISISSKAPLAEPKEYLIHKILALKFADNFFLCKIKSTKVDYFTNLIISGKICWKKPLLSFGWYKTNSTFFQNYAECTSRLHGAVFNINQMKEIFEKFNLQKIEVIQEL